ncbi:MULTISPECIES: hypothetical protein [Prochlorococcus]|uniref:hypothetical protein n=1 Tax=Prochlorococcus TaxID=1218 RepID=UPI0005674EAE|nr:MULTISPECIES: hypothetical protein [Prochlorococcus]
MSQTSIDLIRIPTKDIFIEDDPEMDDIKILGLSNNYLENKDSLNFIPITVIPERGGNYRLIQGHEIFHALMQAGKEWVLALRIGVDEISGEVWKYELGLSNPRLNICNLDANEFETALEYIQRTIKKFSKIKVEKLVQEFANDPTRRFWSSLEILGEAKCGITKTNFPLLSQFLYASPDLSELEPLAPININRASEDEIANQIQRLKIEPDAGKLRKIDALSTARAIVAEEDRIYWSLSKHLFSAKTGLTKPLWPLVETGFFFEPAPTPVPNTSKFLLGQLSKAQLVKEAKSRNLDTARLLKHALVDLLSSNQ